MQDKPKRPRLASVPPTQIHLWREKKPPMSESVAYGMLMSLWELIINSGGTPTKTAVWDAFLALGIEIKGEAALFYAMEECERVFQGHAFDELETQRWKHRKCAYERRHIARKRGDR